LTGNIAAGIDIATLSEENICSWRNLTVPDRQPRKKDHLFDYLLYALAGSVFLTLSYSFLLWLQF